MQSVKTLMCLSVLATVAACDSVTKPEPPVCRVDGAHIDTRSSGNAGCIIRYQDKLLVVQHRNSGAFDTPGGTSDDGETAQCTAHRETFEETGFNVEVGKLVGEAENGFRFYQCTLHDDFGADLTEFSVPPWSSLEIEKVLMLDPYETQADQWRYKDAQLRKLLQMLNETE
ncbi:MAG: NUDIX domain-containing protein [Alteromonadaceae bacterium]|nr:NUDIX domain-containing protein [Alteromonadaceae bacterium]